MKIQLKNILVENRTREVKKDLEFENLKESIRVNGLINPLAVTLMQGLEVKKDLEVVTLILELKVNIKYKLLCGARRYTTLLDLYGPDYEVECTVFPEVSKEQAQLLELDENLRRKNFSWFEEVQLKGDIWCTLTQQNKRYTQEEFSELLGQSKGLTSMELCVYFELPTTPTLILQSGVTGAYEEIRKKKVQKLVEEKNLRERKKLRVVVNSLVAPEPWIGKAANQEHKTVTIQGVKHEAIPAILPFQLYNSAQEMLQVLPDNSIDCCVTDPPFGIGIEAMKGRQRELYENKDLEQEYKELLAETCVQLARVLRPGSHLYMFFSFRNLELLTSILKTCEFSVYPHPLIWVKQPLIGSTQQPEFYPAMVYEPCLIAFNKGAKKRLVKMGQPNVTIERMVEPSKKKHPLEFPVNVYKNLMERSCLPGDVVIDPFCGCGASIQAALELGLTIHASEIKKEYRVFAEERGLDTFNRLRQEILE